MANSDLQTKRESTPDAPGESARAKPLKPLPLMELPHVPARMVNEVLYCERLMYLEWVQNEWDGNQFTADGTRVHKRVDASKRKLAAPKAAPDSANATAAAADATSQPVAATAAEEAPYQARSVWLTSDKLGLTAKLDVVDVAEGRTLAVEYKRGKRPNVPEGAYLPERAQLCCHVLLLRDNGYTCDGGEIYFAADHHRTPITIDDELIATTLAAVARVRELAQAQQIPPPLVDSPKCPHCSLNSICLPDETNHLRAKHLPLMPFEDEAAEPQAADPVHEAAEDELSTEVAQTETKPAVRQLFASRDEKMPMYVTTQGAAVRLDGHQLLVYAEGQKLHEARLPSTSHLSLFGNVQISTQALRSLLGRGIGVHFFSYGGWWAGACVGADSNNVELRLAQYRAAENVDTCLVLAKGWVQSKLANCRTLLRRNHKQAPPEVLRELKILARKAAGSTSMASLLGIEGTAARLYFSQFEGMLAEGRVAEGFSWESRKRRPPTDRLNALLSFCYSLLTKDVVATCRTAGLDPLLGFYHQPQFGRPSLALDLMEEFRPLVADSTVLNVINNGVVSFDDFLVSGGAVALSDKARRKLIQTYEKRLSQEVLHPVFGYRVSYRRVLELQARLLGRYLLGEIDNLPAFRTR